MMDTININMQPEWPVIALNDIVEINGGYPSSDIRHNDNGSFWYIQVRDINDDGFIKGKNLIRFTPKIKPNNYLIKQLDILFQSRGADHKAILFKSDLPNAISTYSFYILRIKDLHILPAYLVWYLNTPKLQNKLKSMTIQSTLSYLSLSSIAKLEIIVPPLEIQEKIIKIDQLRRKEITIEKRLSELKERYLNNYLQKYINRKGE